MSGYTAHTWEFVISEEDYKALGEIVPMLTEDERIELLTEIKWLKLMRERYTKLGNSIEHFDLGNLTMAYLDLGNAISKVVGPDLWEELDETEINKG